MVLTMGFKQSLEFQFNKKQLLELASRFEMELGKLVPTPYLILGKL